MNTFLSANQSATLVSELDGLRIGLTDLTSLHTVRDLREWTDGDRAYRSFALGNMGGAAGGHQAGSESQVCLCRMALPLPHVVVEPDSLWRRVRGRFGGEQTLERGDGIRVGSQAGDTSALPVDALLALGVRHPDTQFEALDNLVVAWADVRVRPELVQAGLVDFMAVLDG